MSIELDRFMNNVRTRLPGALDNTIKLEVFNTLDEFCRETNAWQETLPVPVIAGQTTYEIESEEYRALIVRLMGVTAGGIPGVNAWLPTPEQLVFRLPPDPGTEYKATVALTVTEPVNPVEIIPEIPDWFISLYTLELQDGVLSKMMSQPAKPYTSQAGLIYHGRRFRNGMSRVRDAVDMSNTYGAQAWRFPAFAQCRKVGGSS